MSRDASPPPPDPGMPVNDAGAASRPTTYNLLFVCSGNTCRSPMAMAIARRLLEERGWSHVAVRSAGTGAAPGRPATDAAIRAAEEAGADLSEHASAPLTRELVAWADMILVMGPAHLGVVAELGGETKAALITDCLDGLGRGQPVEDPFGGDDDVYRRTFQQLEFAVEAVLARLEPILAP
jgi:protein-tyrosine-phosphatase